MSIRPEKYAGCLLGLATGDTRGAPFEGGPLERLLWKAIGRTREGRARYTDDTQMSMDLAGSFIENGGIDQEHLARTFAAHYRWSRGYGPAAAWLLRKIRNGARWQDVNRARFSDGSFGNGAAMRAPVLALCYPHDEAALDEGVTRSSEITHAHPLAIEGARLIALVTRAALHERDTEDILRALSSWCESPAYRTRITACRELLGGRHDVQDVGVIRRRLGNGIAATGSCVTAVYFALGHRCRSVDAMLGQVCRLGGDADTIGAMAGAIWGAFNGSGAFDPAGVREIENADVIIALAAKLHAHSSRIDTSASEVREAP